MQRRGGVKGILYGCLVFPFRDEECRRSGIGVRFRGSNATRSPRGISRGLTFYQCRIIGDCHVFLLFVPE